MPYNERIAQRIEAAVSRWKGIDEKKMFGGVCRLINGNMFCGVYKNYLILRLGEDGATAALQNEHARPFDSTGRPMKGWIMLSEEGIADDAVLGAYLAQAKAFALSLPAK